MATDQQTICDNLDLWTSALLTKSTAGRGSNGKLEAYGIKKLRELILELAVRGKLVPQDPNDRPSSDLLKKIATEKRKLVKEGNIKKENFPEISDEEIPYQLPDGWEWVRLGEYVHLEMGQSPSSNSYNQEMNGLPFFQGKADFGDIYPTARYWCTHPQKFSFPGDVLLSVRAPVGPTNISNIECCIGRGLAALRPLASTSTQFLLILMRAFQERLASLATGTTFVAVSKKDIESLVVCVPPLAEQHRIVAKVDELMALCNRLEQQQTDSIAAHQTLVEILLGTLTGVASPQELSVAWTRIANHFDTLFTTEHSIDQLKQTILQLAVMGKLAPQDPNDEPASVLLEKIAEEKERLADEGNIKKQKERSAISDEDKLFNLPMEWQWVRLGDISILKGGFAYKSSDFLDTGECQVVRMGNIRPDYLRLDENPVFIPKKLGEETADYQIECSDILLTMTGTKGKRDYLYSLLVLPEHLKDRKLYLNQRLCIVRGLLVVPEFMNMTIKDERLLDAVYGKSTGTANQANIGMVALNDWILPLPPLDEQHRIVAKVNELMALCDTLKARLADAQTTQIHLADAIVEQAVA
jgi:type I restriction enzyme S subunit